MSRKKKLTRKQKIKMNPHGSGNSKYAKKIKRRKKTALALGLSENATMPEIDTFVTKENISFWKKYRGEK